ncbi:MAG: hypothetical protein O3A46_00805 [Candidatus Poribacteria bacterium]|nr:hypothetical protein [Candidatus Poribacteria bacterium]
MIRFTATLAALLVCATANATVWWEGEDTAETNFPKSTYFDPQNEREASVLSGGKWLSNGGERTGDEAFARYEINVPEAGTYDFWTRKFWHHGPFRWQFDGGEWREARRIALADSASIRTHLGANWVYLGEVELSAGTHTFELRLLAGPGESLTGCFDAFFLTQEPFKPNGKYKPGERSGNADPGFFPFEPPMDRFTEDAALDLRYLNEDAAGESGFVQHDGNNFTLGNGEPVRFWGVNVSSGIAGQQRKSVDYLARKLAKLGVNAVRFHSGLFDASEDPANIDTKALDDLHYLVAAMKKQGIYTTISFYFPLWFDIRPEYGIEGYDTIDNKRPFALLTFNERMQEIYNSWARAILTTENPYTGVALADEPAALLVEIINEDSYFFWTFTPNNVPAVHWNRLETLYSAWLAERYGSVGAAFEAWGDIVNENDDRANGHVGLFPAWDMTMEGSHQSEAKTRRIGDQVRFLTEHQREFYATTTRYFKEELGYGGLVSPSNWHVSDGVALDALERYTYTAGDVIDRHGYFGGRHQGDGSGYSVRVDHTYEDRSALKRPENLPFHVFQMDGYPHIVSEIGWPQPNRFRAEMTFLSGAYGALQGVDGYFFFAVNSPFLDDGEISKFGLGTPSIVSTFPAAALMYRRGDVPEADYAIRQVLRLDDLYAMKGSGAATPEALDALRLADVPGERAHQEISVYDPLIYYVGKVARTFGEDPSESYVKSPLLIDRNKGYVVSHGLAAGSRDESRKSAGLALFFKDGVAVINSRQTEGLVGFLADTEYNTSHLELTTSNEYLSLIVTSLDGEPIPTSKRLLIQAMTEDRPYGFKSEDGKIVDLGSAPFGVREIDANVTLRLDNLTAATVKVLDENGYVRSLEDARIEGNALELTLPKDALYTIVER